jgi:predicted transcriptional regulator
MLYYAIIINIILLILLFALYGLSIKAPKTKMIFLVLQPTGIISGVIISFLFSALFITMGPMPIDRSYSIFIIADMYENPDKVFSQEEIERVFKEKYIQKNEATKRRIEEQKSIGNIEQVMGGYSITKKGRRLIEIMRFVELLYPVDEKRTLYPEWQGD